MRFPFIICMRDTVMAPCNYRLCYNDQWKRGYRFLEKGDRAFPFAGECPDVSDTLPVLHQTSMGKVHTMIVKGSAKEVESKVKAYDPILVDILPLTLEEIFIYE